MGEDKRYITICDEDILNINNAIEHLLEMASTTKSLDFLEVFTLRSIVERYNKTSSVECEVRKLLETNKPVSAIKKARELLKCDLIQAKNYVDNIRYC